MDVSSEPEHKAYKETGFCQHLLSLSVTFFFLTIVGLLCSLFEISILKEPIHCSNKQKNQRHLQRAKICHSSGYLVTS